MAVVITLDRMLQARGMTLSELAGRIDITLANLSILKTGKARAIRFSTLDAICRELQCTPGELLGYDPTQAHDGG
ncbi:helix-turn-helix transcriptional regulator [Stenotrophomonas sp. TWI169]|uniref:helix-turn-helix domain-containing protein n=1 Tax=Stenotrophomonas sp. TWI169 TaxID=3136773 RepID=UPI003207E762